MEAERFQYSRPIRIQEGLVIVLLAVLLGHNAGHGQSGGGYEVIAGTVNGGGGSAEFPGSLAAVGTIAQFDIGALHGGNGGYVVLNGFWALPAVESSCICIPFGDIEPVGSDCDVDVDDILRILDAFIDPPAFPEGDIAPCGGGDGNVDVDDILAELDAFSGVFACAPNCIG